METDMTTRGSSNQHSRPSKTTEATASAAAENDRKTTEAAAESAEATAETARRAADVAAEAVSDTPAEVVATTAEDAVAAVASRQAEATRAMESIGQTMLDGATRMQQEIVDFVSARVREDMETQKELLRCRSFDDVREVQTRFFRTAMEQYAAESKRLMDLGSDVIHRPANRGA
jgi:hypothetical protein